MIGWLHRHHDDVSIGHSRGDMAHLERLSDSWTQAEFTAVNERRAWGDHFTLTALCGAIREKHRLSIRIKVRRPSGQVDFVSEPMMAETIYDATLHLAFSGNHYLSIINERVSSQCAHRAQTRLLSACSSEPIRSCVGRPRPQVAYPVIRSPSPTSPPPPRMPTEPNHQLIALLGKASHLPSPACSSLDFYSPHE